MQRVSYTLSDSVEMLMEGWDVIVLRVVDPHLLFLVGFTSISSPFPSTNDVHVHLHHSSHELTDLW